MTHTMACSGSITLGTLARASQQLLARLPGEWLEFDPGSARIVVRLCQPSASPSLPTIASELVRMLAELTGPERAAIPGGELYVHPEGKAQPARLRVDPGGVLEICWAFPDYSRAQRRPYCGREVLVEPALQCLNGSVSFVATARGVAVRDLETLAQTFEGLYPEGRFTVGTDEREGRARIELHDVNLDVSLLIDRLQQLAVPGSATGRIEVSSFAATDFEEYARFVFDAGQVWVERPALWEAPRPAPAPPLEPTAR